MLNIITTGNAIKFLQLSCKTSKGVISRYKLKNNTFIYYMSTNTWFDNFNKISTGKVHYKYKSVYLFRYLCSNFIVVWARIVFKGKGFRIRNFQKELKLTLNFGHSHWDRIKFYKFWFFWKKRRQNHLILTYNNDFFREFYILFPYIKLLNRYTKRGLRLKKQPIVRRFGKISQHISSLH